MIRHVFALSATLKRNPLTQPIYTKDVKREEERRKGGKEKMGRRREEGEYNVPAAYAHTHSEFSALSHGFCHAHVLFREEMAIISTILG